jgi:hypothetical protein
LFPSFDGFLDILEIKKPNHEVMREDSSHPGSFMWASEANKALGQVVNYIHQMELNQLQLAQRINREYREELGIQLFTIKPRAYILIGQSNGWSEIQKEVLRKLNYALHGIEVLTYTDLIRRGEGIIDLYTRKLK